MNSKKITSIIGLIDISMNNLKLAKEQLLTIVGDKAPTISTTTPESAAAYRSTSADEYDALEVVEGYFDGENMVGDNGKMYPVPPNYASKTQLIIGDRMKRILTTSRESFKLIKPAERVRVVGQFQIDPQQDMYLVVAEGIKKPIRILKASATFAMKNLGLRVGDMVAVIIPKDATPTWGALSSVVTDGDSLSPYAKGNIEEENKPDSSFDASTFFDSVEEK